jgi:sugar/nucleoside kinase (ribokinase family)
VVDTTGAGDAFCSGFLHGLLSAGGGGASGVLDPEASLRRALRMGCAMGSVLVTKVGERWRRLGGRHLVMQVTRQLVV